MRDNLIMKFGALTILTLISICLLSCQTIESMTSSDKEPTKLVVADSVMVGNIVVYNGFKHQINFSAQNFIDSSLISDNLYFRHQILWDSCYGVIFGPDNSRKFQSIQGMISWNRSIFKDEGSRIDSISEILISYNLDSLYDNHVLRFNQLGYQTPSARITFAFTPLTGVGFGGCSNDQFIYELNNPEYDIIYALEKGFPHEIYHMLNEDRLEIQDEFTALDLSINEGLACYMTEKDFFKGKISSQEAVEDMNLDDWEYYLRNEKAIFKEMKPYFDDVTGDNPLLQKSQSVKFKDAPRSIYYWLGYRIIESFVAENPGVKIDTLLSIPYNDIYKYSKYEEKFQ